MYLQNVRDCPTVNLIQTISDKSKQTNPKYQNDYPDQMLHLWQGYWQQMGGLPGFVASGISRRGCTRCSGSQKVKQF